MRTRSLVFVFAVLIYIKLVLPFLIHPRIAKHICNWRYICQVMDEEGSETDATRGDSRGLSTPSSVDEVFDKFKGYLDTRLREFSDAQAASSSAAYKPESRNTRKLQREAEAQKLKKKGNNKQFLFNSEVLDELKSITEDIQSEELVSALRSSKRASKLVERRQKLIKLADKSEAGWLAVDEYESDELADDSADEKRIKKAQEKATKKRKDNAKSLAATAAPRNTRSLPYSSRRQDSSFFRGLYRFVFL